MKTITRETLKADGLTVGESMDKDAAALRELGIPARDGMKPFDELREDRREAVRRAILDTLDEKLGGKGWIDADLPNLFKAIDKQVELWEARLPIADNLKSLDQYQPK